MGHRFPALTIFATIAAFCCAASAEPSEADGTKTAAVQQPSASEAATATAEPKVETSRYYIDFRVAEDGAVGHTYIAYGRLGANARPASVQYNDYHPEGGFSGYVAGFIAPITAVMQPAKETLRSKVVDNYRVILSENDYRKLTRLIAQVRASRRPWTAFGYNCNDFLADAARAIGLQAPGTNMTPYQFVPLLRSLNASAGSAVRASIVPTSAASASSAAKPATRASVAPASAAPAGTAARPPARARTAPKPAASASATSSPASHAASAVVH